MKIVSCVRRQPVKTGRLSPPQVLNLRGFLVKKYNSLRIWVVPSHFFFKMLCGLDFISHNAVARLYGKAYILKCKTHYAPPIDPRFERSGGLSI